MLIEITLSVMTPVRAHVLDTAEPQAGSDHLWEIADIAMLVEAAEAKPAKRGPYRKRDV